VALVDRLVTSSFGRELAAARRRETEVEFLLAWPPDDKPPSERGEVAADARPILHGFIDCLFQDARGDWHVVDYKTNQSTAADVPRLVEMYRLQLALYAIAAERATGVPPASLRLCFLVPEVVHSLTWNAAERREAIALFAESFRRIEAN